MDAIRIRALGWTILSLALALLIGCGPKAIKKESVLDTPDNHFSQGMREFDRGNYANALVEFERAKALDPDYPEAYAGMALVHAWQDDFKSARDLIDKALDKNGKSVKSRIIKGRILTRERKGDDWAEDAVKEFKKAIEVDPNSSEAYFYMGITHKEAYDFSNAALAFTKVIEMKKDFSTEANEEWATIQKIQRAAPGTKVGAKIALIPEIDRADLAVLLMEELKLMTLLDKKRKKVYDTGFKAPDDPTKMQQPGAAKLPDATDIDGHWAKSWIKDILKARGMEAFPDHTFRPDEKITRSNYAKTLEQILVLVTGDEGLATKYVGERSRFPDVNSSNFAYNSMALMVDRGIMSADKITGEFRPGGSVSGADALLIIRDFQNALRMEF